MIGLEDISQWLGQDVIDRDGEKLGRLEDVYIDVTTDEPRFGVVRIGFVGRHRLVFVPLAEASAGQQYVQVNHAKKQVRDAPTVELSNGVSVDMEPGIYAHYEMPYEPASTPSGRRLARPLPGDHVRWHEVASPSWSRDASARWRVRIVA